jgi:hypothetical protein
MYAFMVISPGTKFPRVWEAKR